MSDELRAAQADAVRKIQVLLGRVLTFVASLDSNLESKLTDEAGSFDSHMSEWLQQLTDIKNALNLRKKLIQEEQIIEDDQEITNGKKLVLETIHSLESLYLRTQCSDEPNEIKQAIKSVESMISSGSDLFNYENISTNEREERLINAISSFERLINHAPDADVVDKLKSIYSQMTLILLNIIQNTPIKYEDIKSEETNIEVINEEKNIKSEECKLEEIKQQAEEIVSEIESLAINDEDVKDQFNLNNDTNKKENKKQKNAEEIKTNEEEKDNKKNSKFSKKHKKRSKKSKEVKKGKEDQVLDWYEESLKEEQQEEFKEDNRNKIKDNKEGNKKNNFSALRVLKTHVPGVIIEQWPLSDAAVARGHHGYICKLPGIDLESRSIAGNKRTARAEAAALMLDKIVTLQKLDKLPEDAIPLSEEQIHLLNTLEAHNWPNRLQKFCSKLHKQRPTYSILETRPKFVIKCEACDLSGVGINTKKIAAKKEAAKSVLEQLEEWNY